ncbi:helix-turn-helix transcriptional regulator [Allonocardiopsis opalescens]|uniref:Putative DNA-binding transcriptional regulator YafY n=1 Tax=Allonocardiopsis opalescens TaxID=1144618 RepID=A0A2T0Q4Y2_9ACTN|nr:WYL domain-containing protein [Allonocardiopsis opalescens]PRX98875.1 putative DNA-binding transcriptional regulator YafY [Allonocardiopsis opalescens]
MRAGRLVALLLTLQRQPRGATAAALAAALEVSERTVYRDVAALQAAGVPLWAEPGPGGGFRLVEGWRTRLDGLTSQEAGALFLGGAPDALAELGLGTVLVAAQAKVLATLPPELRGRATRIRERFHLDAPGWFQRREELPHLGALAEAVWEQRRIAMEYRRGDRSVRRLVEPLGLVLKAGMWYLVARVPDGTGGADAPVRTYRVARVAAAEAGGGERFERPAGFDLAEWWAESAVRFDGTLLRDRVRLRLSPLGLRRLPHVLGSLAAAEAAEAAGPPDAEGWRPVEVGVESLDIALSQLVALGAEVEVLEPPSLRAELAALGAAIARRNAAPPLPG